MYHMISMALFGKQVSLESSQESRNPAKIPKIALKKIHSVGHLDPYPQYKELARYFTYTYMIHVHM